LVKIGQQYLALYMKTEIHLFVDSGKKLQLDNSAKGTSMPTQRFYIVDRYM
jgi:hypothetical protein